MPVMHYWLVTNQDGQDFLIYGGSSEETARQEGLEMLSGIDFFIKPYPTRNLAMASSMHKGRRLKDGDGLRKSSQRLGHDRSIKRLKRRSGI